MNITKKLLTALDAQAGRLSVREQYYAGEQPLAYLSTDAREAIGSGYTRMATNVPRLAVTSLSERLRVTGFTIGGTTDVDVWKAWTANNLDQLAGTAHREALTLGRAYVLVWAHPVTGLPLVTVESAHQVIHATDPATGVVTAAVKRYQDGNIARVVTYEPSQITVREMPTTGDITAVDVSNYTVTEVTPNPLGVVPVVPIVNRDRLLDTYGRSELDDLMPLVDALNKQLADLMVASEYFARPRRWATGIELVEDSEGQAINPYSEGVKMMVAEKADAKFGSLPAADLSAYEAGVRTILGQIMAVSSLPAHYVGILTQQPASADALRAAEASLSARAADRQSTFGIAWEQVATLIHAVSGHTPAPDTPRVQWADPATRSVAQEADAAVKLYQASVLPLAATLARMGYTADEIERIRIDRRNDALDAAAIDLTKGVA